MTPEARQQHADAMRRASYYRWAADRDSVLPGGDPITGKARQDHRHANPMRQLLAGEGRVAYLAMARYWLGVARQIRTGR